MLAYDLIASMLGIRNLASGIIVTAETDTSARVISATAAAELLDRQVASTGCSFRRSNCATT